MVPSAHRKFGDKRKGCSLFTNLRASKALAPSEREIVSVRKKSVCFNLTSNQTYRYSRKLSNQEVKQICWFTEAELQKFKDEHAKVVTNLFKRKSEWKETFRNAYGECRKVKQGNMEIPTGQVDRESLVQVYRRHDEFAGMEKYVLFALRGPVAKQILRILNHVDNFEKQRQELSLARKHCALEECVTLLSLKCRTMTQPSTVLVREMAMAHALACRSEST